MNYTSRSTLPDSLGITPKRLAELNALFGYVCDNLPDNARRTELHQGLAPFLKTPEEAYYMGNLAREFISNLSAAMARPITPSAN